MKMTLKQFVNERLAFILESEEYLISQKKESGLRGNAINSEGDAIFSDDEGNYILLEDIVRIEDVRTLQYMYPNLTLEQITNLRNAFYSIYSFIDPEVYYARLTNSVLDDLKDVSYWESLVDGLF